MATIDFTSVLEEHQAFVGRAWVLHAIDTWLNAPDASHYFLLTGKVGAGKTAVAAHLVHLSRGAMAGILKRLGPGSIAYYHFCQPRNDSTLAPVRFVESLSETLAARYPVFAQALVNVDTTEVNIHTKQVVQKNEGKIIGVAIGSLRIGNLSARTAFERVVRQPLAELYSSNFNETILIVIDSLDTAYTYSSSETIASLLRDVISDLPPAVRFLLTSQTVDQLPYDFSPPTLDLNENEAAAFQDIRTYAEQRLNQRAEPERTDLAQRIAVKADGNFVYAHHVLDLGESMDGQSIDDLLTAKVEGLGDFYRQTMKRVFHPNTQQWNQQDRRLFALLCAAQGRGLTTRQLARFLGQPEAELDMILTRCDPYLTGPRRGPFHFFHDSFRDFLLDDSAYRMDPAVTHHELGLCLLDDYGGKWLESNWAAYETRYALHFTSRHLVSAAKYMAQSSQHEEAVKTLARLLALFTDFNFLETKSYRVGMGYILTDLQEACEIALQIASEQSEPYLLFKTLEVLLYYERNNLQEWDPTQQPAFFAQQIRNRAVQLKHTLHHTDHFVAAAEQRLTALKRPYLALTWQTNAPASDPTKSIAGHARAVRAIAITPDGQRAISGSDDRSIIIWNLQEQVQEHKRRLHTNVVTSLAVASDGHYALSGSADTTVKLWNLRIGTVERTLKGHRYSIQVVAMTPDDRYAVSASISGKIKIWNLQDSASEGPDQTFQAHACAIRDLAITANGQHIISASDDQTIKVWDRTGTALYTLEGHTAPVLSVSVTPDDRFILSASADGTLGRCELATGGAVDPLIRNNTSFLHIAPTLDGRRAVSTAYDVALHVWDLRAGELLRTIPAHHREAVAALAITHNGQRAITAGEDGALKYWNLVTGSELATIITGHTDKVSAVAITSGGERAISAAWDGELKLWDLQANATQAYLVRTIKRHASRVRTVVITPDDRYAVSGDHQGNLRVWDMQTGALAHHLKRAGQNAHADAILSLALTSDSRYAVAASVDKTLTVWNLKTGKQTHRLSGHSDSVNAVAITPDGRAISASADGTLRIWDLRKGKLYLTINAHSGQVISIVVIDDSHAISVSGNGTYQVWDLATGKQVDSDKRYGGWRRTVAYTPDGSRAIFITTAQPLQIWDLDSRTELARVVQDSALRCAAVTRDGNMIVAGDGLGNVFCFRYIAPDNGQMASSPSIRMPQIYLEQHVIEDEITQRHLPDPNCRFVLIEGDSGIGKTALLTGLADAKPGWLHYFIAANPLAMGCADDVRALLYTIGRQFARTHPALFPTDSEHHFHQHLTDVNRLADLTLLEPAKRLQASRPDAQIVVLIDGLDTFADQQAQESVGAGMTILHWLTHGPELPGNIRVVLTSAPGAHLTAFKTERQRWLGQIQLQPYPAYLRRIVKHLKNGPARHDLAGNAQDPTASLDVERLLANLHNNFQAAIFIIGCLLHTDNRPNPKLYRQLLTPLLSSADLFHCYAAFLEQLYDQVQAEWIEIQTEGLQWSSVPAWPWLYQPMLGVLAVAKAPLTIEQIANLGHIPVSTRWLSDGLRKFEPLLCTETSTASVHKHYRFFHRSIAAFLLSSTTQRASPQFYLDAKEWHRKIVAHYVGTYAGDWAACDDYGLCYLMQHVIHAELPEPTRIQVLNQLYSESYTFARLARTDNSLSLIVDWEQIETRIAAQTMVQLYSQIMGSKQLPRDLLQHLLSRLAHLQAGHAEESASTTGAH